MTERHRIKQEAWRIVTDPVAKRLEQILALQLVAACNGIIVGAVNSDWLTSRQQLRLQQAQQKLVANTLDKKEKRKVANRKAYLRRQLRQLEQQELDAAMLQQQSQPRQPEQASEGNNE